MTLSVPQIGQGTNSCSPIASNSKFSLHCGQWNSIDATTVFFIIFPPYQFRFKYAIKRIIVVFEDYIETAYLYLTMYHN